MKNKDLLQVNSSNANHGYSLIAVLFPPKILSMACKPQSPLPGTGNKLDLTLLGRGVTLTLVGLLVVVVVATGGRALFVEASVQQTFR